MVIFGLALVPLRGWFLRKNYERRLRLSATNTWTSCAARSTR